MLYRDLNQRYVAGRLDRFWRGDDYNGAQPLCPGVDPSASFGLVYRDPQAAFPHKLWGRWYDNRRACADPGRIAPDYESMGS